MNTPLYRVTTRMELQTVKHPYVLKNKDTGEVLTTWVWLTDMRAHDCNKQLEKDGSPLTYELDKTQLKVQHEKPTNDFYVLW